MELISIQFFIFVIAGLLIYYVFPKKYQWVVLLFFSYFYYLLICNKYIIYMLVTTVTTYFGAIIIEKNRLSMEETVSANKKEWSRDVRKSFRNKMGKKRFLVLTAVLIINFGILGFLKYFDFLAQSIIDLFNCFGLNMVSPELGLLLPLGISFYTFQTMGYIIDVYREKVVTEKNIAKFALFVSFFPQIIQGPIAFYSDLAHQLYEEHKLEIINLKNGFLLILWGIFKKLVIADRAVKMINYVLDDMDSFSGTFILMAALMYAIQLYADFSGGIDICRGVGEMFGITMAENFRRPYFSKSLTEYWHRWHITLGNWVRAYVFYPLSISKNFLNMAKWLKPKFGKHISKVIPTSIASLLTFLIIGLWHGANSKYIAFGLWNGLVIMFAELFKPLNDKIGEKLHIKKGSRFSGFISIFWTFILVLVGYYFDIAKSFSSAMWMLYQSLFNFHISDFNELDILEGSGLSTPDYIVIFAGILIILVVSIIQERSKNKIRDMLYRKNEFIQCAVVMIGIFAIILFGYYGPGIDPSEFVYMQF